MWDGDTVPPKIMNTAEFFLLLLALFILTSILSENFLPQTISEINRKYTEINGGGTAPPNYHLLGNVTGQQMAKIQNGVEILLKI